MSKFFPLAISKIENCTEESVVIVFDIHPELTNTFCFEAGQYITISAMIDGEEVRRAYSLCSAPYEKSIAVGVKKVEGGKMSTFLNKKASIGDILQVMPPAGNFVISTDSEHNNHYVGICAGSGITPILSMIKQVMKVERSKFTLLYGNRSNSSTMFKKELNTLLSDYPERFEIVYAFSKEMISGNIHGRLDKQNVQQFMSTRPDFRKVSAFYLCGPGEMIDQMNEILLLFNVPKSNIYFERFTASDKASDDLSEADLVSDVTVIVDGEEFDFQLHSDDESILDAAMSQGADVPFSCKGGVCCVCKAKVIEGKVRMRQNFSLSEDEIEDGFVLSCQSHPESDRVVMDFDVI